jgi:2TM domain
MKQSTNFYPTDPGAQKKGFRIHLLVFVIATPVMWLVWYLTGQSYPWPLWSTPAWLVGIIFHYLAIYVFKKSTVNSSH